MIKSKEETVAFFSCINNVCTKYQVHNLKDVIERHVSM